MKISEILRRIARTDEIRPRKWKVEVATRWQIEGATEPVESGGAKLCYEGNEGSWRYFADLKLQADTYSGNLSQYVEKAVLEDDAPAWLVMPFVAAFQHSALNIVVRDPFSVDDIPF